MSLAPAGPHPNPLPKGEGDLYSFGVVGYHDPARGDSRIAPVRDSRGCGGSRPSLFRERDMVPDQSLMPAAPAHQGMKIGAPVGGFVREAFVPPLRPLDSGPVSAFGACFCGKDEVGSPCGHRWWYRDLRSFAGC